MQVGKRVARARILLQYSQPFSSTRAAARGPCAHHAPHSDHTCRQYQERQQKRMLSLFDKLGARVGSVVPCHATMTRVTFLKRGCSGFPIPPFIQCLYSCSVEFRTSSLSTCSACSSATVDQIRDQVWFLQRWWRPAPFHNCSQPLVH